MGRFIHESRLGFSSSERVEEQVREETVEFDQDAGSEAEPDGGEHRSGGNKFFHDGKPKRLGKRLLSDIWPGSLWLT
jgi:hypothetical protein